MPGARGHGRGRGGRRRRRRRRRTGRRAGRRDQRDPPRADRVHQAQRGAPRVGDVGLPAVTTSIAVLQAVIRLVRRRRPGKIIVGDRLGAHLPVELRVPADGAARGGAGRGRRRGLRGAAAQPRTRPRGSLVQPPGWEETWRAQGGILAMRKILEADHFIDLPVCKNHRWAAISLSMKNLIGAIGDESRDPIHYTEGDADRISRDIAILNGAFRPLISIIDARAALINGGPEGVGTDRVTVTPRAHLREPRPRGPRRRRGLDDEVRARAHRRADARPDARAAHEHARVGAAADRARHRARPRRGQRRPRGAALRGGARRRRDRGRLPGRRCRELEVDHNDREPGEVAAGFLPVGRATWRPYRSWSRRCVGPSSSPCSRRRSGARRPLRPTLRALRRADVRRPPPLGAPPSAPRRRPLARGRLPSTVLDVGRAAKPVCGLRCDAGTRICNAGITLTARALNHDPPRTPR